MNKKTVTLSEYKTASSDQTFFRDDTDKINSLNLKKEQLDDEDRKLALSLAEKGILNIRELRTGLEISTNSYIGVARFSNFTLKVIPKYSVNMNNLTKLIAYALEIDDIKNIENEINFEKEEEILIEIIIKLFIKQCETLLKHGLFKSYVEREENIPYLRGKLLLKQQFFNEIKNNAKFACQFDELEYNNLENQTLKFALKCSYSLTESDSTRKDIHRLIHQFEGLVDDKIISTHDFDKISYNRLNSHYESLHDLARLIIESAGIGEYYEPRERTIKSFFVDMNIVFEKFVFRLFKKYYSGSSRFKVVPQKGRKAWRSDYGDINIRTDILVSDKIQNRRYIIDTKYKEKVNNSDLYQMGFYIHEYKEKIGFLILPKFEESTGYTMISEQQEISIILKRINLNEIIDSIYTPKTKDELKHKLQEIAPASF